MTLAEQQALQFEKGMLRVIRQMQALILSSGTVKQMMDLDATSRVLLAPQLYTSILGALSDSGYRELYASLANRDKELIADVKSARSTAGLPTGFTATSKDVINAFRSLELSKFDHIGQSFVNTLHGELMNYALTGMSETEFIANLSNALEGKFQKYAVTYANTSRAQFVQAVQNEAAKNYDGELFWSYEGAEDDKNRDACIEGLDKGVFTNEEKLEFEARTADERAWNCRHVFVQITKEEYEERK